MRVSCWQYQVWEADGRRRGQQGNIRHTWGKVERGRKLAIVNPHKMWESGEAMEGNMDEATVELLRLVRWMHVRNQILAKLWSEERAVIENRSKVEQLQQREYVK